MHGSLARAGKVKGQTPKVAKQEDKKKKLTGRAKKRILYNRRFVNAVAGFGKRRVFLLLLIIDESCSRRRCSLNKFFILVDVIQQFCPQSEIFREMIIHSQ